MSDDDASLATSLQAWTRLLSRAPDDGGGDVVLVTTDSSPPSLAMLTTASVHLQGDNILIAVQRSSSAAHRPAQTCTLLMADGETARRLEVLIVERRPAGPYQVIVGRVDAARDMRESPWVLNLRFAAGAGDPQPLLRTWQRLRLWLSEGAVGAPPGTERLK